MLTRLSTALRSRAAPAWVGALAVLLSLPALAIGLQTDDHMLMLQLDQGTTPPWDLFTVTGDEVAESRQRGEFTSWTSPDLHIRFLRPLSALTHALEHTLWRDSPWAMHLVNALIYGLLAAVAALLYRRLLGPGSAAAGLAALMFAVDDGHAFAVGWISSRNTSLATLFALLALLLHLRGGQLDGRAARAGSALCTGLALLSGEVGVSALALIAAHAVTLDDRPRRARLAALLPHAAVALVWAAAYVALDCGARGTGWYRDIHGDPFGALLQGLFDLPLWLLTLLGPSIANVASVFALAKVRWLSLALVVPILALLRPALRRRPARFFAAAALFSLLPLLATMPQDRVIVAASFGAFGWIACAIDDAAHAVSGWMRGGRRALIAMHLVVAPLLFVPATRSLQGFERAAQDLAAVFPDGAVRDVVAVDIPLELLSLYAPAIQRRAGKQPYASLHVLHAGSSPLIVERVDARTLELEALAGWGRVPFEHLFASERRMRSFTDADVAGMRARVLRRTDDGRPLRIRFEFDQALETRARGFVIWKDGRPVPWQPPSIGAHARLPAIDILGSLSR